MTDRATTLQEPAPVEAPAPEAPAPDTTEVRVIRPVKRRVRLQDIWRSHKVARIIAVRDLKLKYKQSILGPPWLILQPLGILAGLVLVFNGVTTVNTGDVPYVLFALTGLGVWSLVQNAMSLGAIAFVQNAELIRRVASPRVAFVTASILSNLVAPAVIVAVTIAGALIDGRSLPPQIVLLPVFAIALCLLMFGVLLILAPVTARFRDAFSLIPFWMQAGLFVTPVGYPLASATPTLKTILSINPLTGILELWRWSIFGTSVDLFPLLTAAGWTLLIVVGGWLLFSRMEVSLVDHL